MPTSETVVSSRFRRAACCCMTRKWILYSIQRTAISEFSEYMNTASRRLSPSSASRNELWSMPSI